MLASMSPVSVMFAALDIHFGCSYLAFKCQQVKIILVQAKMFCSQIQGRPDQLFKSTPHATFSFQTFS